MEPEPLYPPGYTGHLSRYRETFGASYGRVTRGLAGDPTAPKSRKPVLSSTRPIVRGRNAGSRGGRNESGPVPSQPKLPRRRRLRRNIQDHRAGEPALTGYTGYIPRINTHYFGATYGSASYWALEEQDETERKYAAKAETVKRTTSRAGSLRKVKRPSTAAYTLHPASRGLARSHFFDGGAGGGGGGGERGASFQRAEATATVDRQRSTRPATAPSSSRATTSQAAYDVHAATTSPYELPPGHKDRYFVPGWTGHIPGMQNFLGRNFVDTTREALDAVTAGEEEDRARAVEVAHDGLGASLTRGRTAGQAGAVLSGMASSRRQPSPPRNVPIPGSTVHLPGFRHDIGATFGRAAVHSVQDGFPTTMG